MDPVIRFKQDFGSTIMPGLRGPVGNPIQNYELRQSSAELEPVKFALTLDQLRERGSNLQNGTIPSPYTGGYNPMVIENNDYQTEFHPQEVGTNTIGRLDNINMDGFNIPNPGQEWRARMMYELRGSKSDYGFYPLPGGIGQRANNLLPARTRTIFDEENDGPLRTANLNLVGNGGLWNAPCPDDNRTGTVKPVHSDQLPPQAS